MSVLLLILIGYLIGSIPTGWLIARSLGITDIQKVGSGNIGATNVARMCGLQWFLVVFFLDALKAYALLWLIAPLVSDYWTIILCALAVLAGNTCSLFLRFTGGKGIATTIGLLFFLQPIITIFLIISWASVLFCTRTVGIASVVMIGLLPIFSLGNGCSIGFLFFSVVVSSWIMWLHRNNILQFLYS